MRKFYIFCMLVIFSVANVYSQNAQLELGLRYLKLANSYREASKLEKSFEYLELASKNIKSSANKYWIAGLYENYGLYFKDKGMKDSASYYYQEAQKIYNKILKDKDGSRASIEMLMSSIDLENKALNAPNQVEAKKEKANQSTIEKPNSNNQAPNKLSIEVVDRTFTDSLKAKIKSLNTQLDDLKVSKAILQNTLESVRADLKLAKDTINTLKIQNKELTTKVDLLSKGIVKPESKAKETQPSPAPQTQIIQPATNAKIKEEVKDKNINPSLTNPASKKAAESTKTAVPAPAVPNQNNAQTNKTANPPVPAQTSPAPNPPANPTVNQNNPVVSVPQNTVLDTNKKVNMNSDSLRKTRRRRPVLDSNAVAPSGFFKDINKKLGSDKKDSVANPEKK